MLNRTKIMKKVLLSILGILFISIAISSCTKESSNVNNSNKSTFEMYDTDNDPSPILCCIDFTDFALSRAYGSSIWKDNCNSTPGYCTKGVTQGGKEWWFISNSNINNDMIKGKFELLDSKTLLIKIEEYGSNDLKNLYLEKGNYTISSDVYLKLNSDYTLFLKGGVYPLYKSANSEFENVIKVPIEIQ